MIPSPHGTALDRVRRRAFLRLLPLLFTCFLVAYVDRANVAFAKLTMVADLPAFDNAVIGFGAGIFFAGYFVLAIPASVMVERGSARRWIAAMLAGWGVMAALTAVVRTPGEFYAVRFFLGLAEAGFYPGVIVFLTHWFPVRDRAKALAIFGTAAQAAQIVSPKITYLLLKAGWLGLHGWQWVFIAWGWPAIALALVVWFGLPDRARDASWVSPEEAAALEAELAREKNTRASGPTGIWAGLRHPKILGLAAVFFLIITAYYGTEFFIPSILQQWYGLDLNALTWLALLPPMLALVSQLAVGWSSDRTNERRWHAVLPLAIGAVALALAPASRGSLALTLLCFMVAYSGLRAYLPVFWSLPYLILAESAAAGSVGLINSVGNLGGFLGSYSVGKLQVLTGSFVGGLYGLSVCMAVAALGILGLHVGRRAAAPEGKASR